MRDLRDGKPGFVVVEFEGLVLAGAVPGEGVVHGAEGGEV